MSFPLLYFFIPILLFFVKPLKDNKIFVIYILVLSILSYDNVTDYGFFIGQFKDIVNYGSLSTEKLKGLEWGWGSIYSFFSFTEYGFVIIHSITFAIVIYVFLKFSHKVGLLNVSIFLCFILGAFTKHDNIMRQNIAIVFASYAFFDVLKGGSWYTKRILKVGLITLGAFLFHFSAILLIPYYFFLHWFKKKELNCSLVIIIVLILDVIRFLGYSKIILLVGFMLIPAEQSHYMMYYLEGILNDDTNEITISQFIYMFLSVVPLFYFTTFRRKEYKRNMILRLSVNMACITMTWRDFFMDIGFFTRVVDYFLWFEIWGFGFMIKDGFSNWKKTVILRAFVLGVIFIICFKEWGVIKTYYGENNYMTVLSEECRLQQIYDRDVNVSKAQQIRERH